MCGTTRHYICKSSCLRTNSILVSYSLGSCFNTVKGLLYSEEIQTKDLSIVVVKNFSIVSGSVNY